MTARQLVLPLPPVDPESWFRRVRAQRRSVVARERAAKARRAAERAAAKIRPPAPEPQLLPFPPHWFAPRGSALERKLAAKVARAAGYCGIAPLGCAKILSIGRQSGRPAFACLTSTQRQHLFGDKRIRQIGEKGLYATAFAHRDPDKVVKITRDATDIRSLALAQGLDRIPTLYESHRLASATCWRRAGARAGEAWHQPDAPVAWYPGDFCYASPEGPRLFAAVVERLQPLSARKQEVWFPFMECIVQNFRYHDAYGRRRSLPDHCCGEELGSLRPSCVKLARGLPQTILDLQNRGILWTDTHPGNIGLDKHGRWKVLDLGRTARGTFEPPTLRGRR